ncbi:metal ABC transporter ATP-binding protein [Planctomonas psychrotolerans]|uniref:metal ABC transporter ATP-binding protein n=1 Tax=Planctomonas psychrotolerans TaxID=2528712 RepID=UPI00123B2E8F|nr:metal ABC transporter ATP-binding protein [Planctomonas psychrotolerans]
MADPILSVSGVTVRYGTVQALRDVSLDLTAGRILGLLGVNGSGKSSLFGAIMGTVVVDAGRVRLFGGSSAAARKRNLVTYVPQSENVDWDFPLSVREVVLMGRYGMLGFTRRPRRIDRVAVADALDRVGLAELADRQIGELSGGQRKRVFLARGIAQGAGLLLLDEPFAGVDKASERTIVDLLRALRDEGCGILVSTHDLAGVPELCDEVLLLQNRVLFRGAPHEALTPERLSLAFGAEVGNP